MIDPTDNRYHILKDTSTKYKYFKLKLFDDEIRAEKSYQVSGNRVWEQWVWVRRIWFFLSSASTGALCDLGQVPPPVTHFLPPITMWSFRKHSMFFRWKIQSVPLSGKSEAFHSEKEERLTSTITILETKTLSSGFTPQLTLKSAKVEVTSSQTFHSEKGT